MTTSIDNKDCEQEQQMSNPSDRLPYHVSFNDDQKQQRHNSINPDEPLPSSSRHGEFQALVLYLFHDHKKSFRFWF